MFPSSKVTLAVSSSGLQARLQKKGLPKSLHHGAIGADAQPQRLHPKSTDFRLRQPMAQRSLRHYPSKPERRVSGLQW
jgi:hypothetical protein